MVQTCYSLQNNINFNIVLRYVDWCDCNIDTRSWLVISSHNIQLMYCYIKQYGFKMCKHCPNKYWVLVLYASI